MEAWLVVFTEMRVVSVNVVTCLMRIVSDIPVRVTMRSKRMSRINRMSYIMVASLVPISAQHIMISVELYMLDVFVFNSMMSA